MMKNIVLIALIALLTGCVDNQDTLSSRQTGALQVSLSLGDVASRGIDSSIDDGTGKGYTLPFSAINTLTVELYEALDQAPIFTHHATNIEIKEIQALPVGATAELYIADIPMKTKLVKILINSFTDADPSINQLQVTNVDTPPAPVMGRDRIPYQGVTSQLTLSSASDPDKEVVIATVEVAPVLSRFEIKPGTIVVVDPAVEGYTFAWTGGAEGLAKIKGFTQAQIDAATRSAQQNFEEKYGTTASASATYAYQVRLIRQTVTSNINNWMTSQADFYVNYFKFNLKSTELVKNANNGSDHWQTPALYLPNGTYSNLTNTFSAPLASDKVIAYHLFPQSVDAEATLEQIKAGMPHIILRFADIVSGDSRWLTLRSFRNITDQKRITSFRPGYCYILDLSAITLTPWSLALEVRITDKTQTADSDPIIKDFDQTANLPEPDSSELTVGLSVRAWRSKDIVTEL